MRGCLHPSVLPVLACADGCTCRAAYTYAPNYRSDDPDRYTFVLAARNLSSNLRGEREQSAALHTHRHHIHPH